MIDDRFRRYFSEWLDFDGAEFRLGCVIGVFDEDSPMRDLKRIFWTANPLGESLHSMLVALDEAGVLESNEDGQFRWLGRPRLDVPGWGD